MCLEFQKKIKNRFKDNLDKPIFETLMVELKPLGTTAMK